MVSIAKRSSALVLAVLWSVISLILPVTAHAATYNAASNISGRMWYVPAVGSGIAGAPVVAAAATMLGRANPWIAAITLGTPVMQFLLEKHNGNKLAVSGKNAPFPTPPGWTTDSLGPKPPLIAVPDLLWSTGWSPLTFPTGEAACAAACPIHKASANGANSGCNQSLGVGTDMYCYMSSDRSPAGERMTPVGSSLGCPSGYSVSGDVCALTNRDSAKWPADGVPTLVPNDSGTGFEQHPRDPDPLPATPSPAEIQNPSRDYAPDPYGNPSSISFSPLPGGGFQIDQRVQTTNNNQTTTTINNVTINNTGNVINIATTTVPGSIEQASPTATPVGTSGTSSQMPTDYNRETTQQQAVQKLEDIKQGTGAAEAPNYATDTDSKKQSMNEAIKEQAEAVPGQYSGDKSNWFSWVWTPPVGQCQPWVNVIHGQTVTWDVCPYIEKIRNVIGYLLAVATTIAVYAQLFRKNDD